jgi:hypothetical protein
LGAGWQLLNNLSLGLILAASFASTYLIVALVYRNLTRGLSRPEKPGISRCSPEKRALRAICRPRAGLSRSAAFGGDLTEV